MICETLKIITLCRFEELKKCIESLQKNACASCTDLYIGVDFPLKDSHKKGYKCILEYLKDGIEGFANVCIIKQKENKGWYENFISVRQRIYEKYDRFIYLEDDIEVSPNFLAYINKNLTVFEKDMDVQAICGYSYPFEWMEDESNLVKINTYYTAWGYGTWREKEMEMYHAVTMQNFDKIMHRPVQMLRFYKASNNQFCNFVKGMLEYIPVLVQNDEIVKIDMAFSVYIFMNHKYVIFPKVAKTRNIGYNGLGMNCERIQIDRSKPVIFRNFDYAAQVIDDEEDFEVSGAEKLDFYEENNRRLGKFYQIDRRERFRTVLAYILYLILGRELAKRVLGCGEFKPIWNRGKDE